MEVVGYKRAILAVDRDNKLLIAGSFAKHFGPLEATQICLCQKNECYSGFNAHKEISGALNYRPLNYPIAKVLLNGNIRETGGVKKEYIIGDSQKVLKIYWPKICSFQNCNQSPDILGITERRRILPQCTMHKKVGKVDLSEYEVKYNFTWLE